jgi:hypothetical protein
MGVGIHRECSHKPLLFLKNKECRLKNMTTSVVLATYPEVPGSIPSATKFSEK